jgi:hypothetical protein
MRGSFEVSVRDIIQKASSSLLVGGDYDITKACNNPFALRGADGDTAAGSEAGSAIESSAKTLLSQHIHSSPSRKSRDFDAFSQHLISSSIFAPSYTEDEYAMYDEAAEPTVTQTPHHLEIDIRDDQIWMAAKACFARKGFSHALVVFTVSGVIINTLSTYLDYLLR